MRIRVCLRDDASGITVGWIGSFRADVGEELVLPDGRIVVIKKIRWELDSSGKYGDIVAVFCKPL